MEPVTAAAWEGLSLVFSWPNILYPVAGTLLAMLFSTIPGLTGGTLMALAIPLTFGWEPVPVLLLFGALLGGATFMGSVSAILFNIPGTASNAATLLDGHPMARAGRARAAIGCSAAASALGSTIGILVLAALLPVLQSLQMIIGPPEMLMLAVWGLTTVAAFTRGTVVKGLAAGGIGLLLAFVGLDPRTAELRYTFGTLYLRDGLSVVPVFLGVFAVGQILAMSVSDRVTISGTGRPDELSGSVWEGVAAVWRHFGLFFRSSVIGTVVGIIPGIGATVASFIAYGHAQQSAKGGGRFGEGDIRGVLAPEAANDAKDGGALAPTLAFGIPGGAGTALLLAVLTVHGFETGRTMLSDNLPLVFVLIGSLFLSNWITSAVGLSLVDPLARLTTVRVSLLVPVLLGLATVGAYAYRGRLADVWVAFVFGVFGYYLKKFGWPVIPLVIGLVLGPLFEDNLHITLRLAELERIDFWTRPVAMALLGLTLVSLASPTIWRRRRTGAVNKASREGGRGGVVFTLVLLVLVLVLLGLTMGLGTVARMAAGKVVVVTALLLLAQLVLDLMKRPEPGAAAGRREWSGLGWLLALPLMVVLLGFAMAVPVFAAIYLRVRSGERWRDAVLLGVGMWGLVYGILSRALGVPLYEGWVTGWLSS